MKNKDEARTKREIKKMIEAVKYLEKGKAILEQVNEESETYQKGYATIFQTYLHKLEDLLEVDNAIEAGIKVYIRRLQKKVRGPKLYDHKGTRVTIPED